MGWVDEIFNQIGKLSFFTIVYEYQQGLYFRKGIAIDKRVKLWGEKLEEVVAEEKKVIKDNGGHFKVMLPYISCGLVGKNPNFPEGYRKGILTGLPKHPKRFKKDKVLNAGLYFYIPIIDDIVTDNAQERVLNLGNINVPTIDEHSKEVNVSCNIRYQLLDFYRAYGAVKGVCDYKQSLVDYTLAILAKHSRGKKYDEWKDPKMVEKLEEIIGDDLKKRATEKWGLKIHEIYITDNVSCRVHRLIHEGGVPSPISRPIENLDSSS